MVAHMTIHEQEKVKKMTGHSKKTGAEAVRKLNQLRLARGEEPLEHTAVYRFIQGQTHKKSVRENRGRANKSLTKKDVRRLQQARRHLIKSADGEKRITWQMVLDEAALADPPCLRIVQDTMRKQQVRFRHPRNKIALDNEDAKERLRVGRRWMRKPKAFWIKKVHGYYDNKAFPLPLSPKQRKKLRQTRVIGHLRTPGEGVEQGFTKPRTAHSLIGVPSVTISALVAKNRVVMWHVVEGPWNGRKAADIYQGPMLKSLRRVWGKKRSFTIVEDGDRKGNQSNKGVNAKKSVHIKAMKLPPRTPCWMPLDYAIWDRIMKKVLDSAPEGRESKKEFLARLKKCAMSLPKSWVAAQIGRMKELIKGVVSAKGYHSKDD